MYSPFSDPCRIPGPVPLRDIQPHIEKERCGRRHRNDCFVIRRCPSGRHPARRLPGGAGTGTGFRPVTSSVPGAGPHPAAPEQEGGICGLGVFCIRSPNGTESSSCPARVRTCVRCREPAASATAEDSLPYAGIDRKSPQSGAAREGIREQAAGSGALRRPSCFAGGRAECTCMEDLRFAERQRDPAAGQCRRHKAGRPSGNPRRPGRVTYPAAGTGCRKSY